MTETAVLAEMLDLDPGSEVDLAGLAHECGVAGFDPLIAENYDELTDMASSHGYRP